MRLGVGGDPLAAAVGHARGRLEEEQALLGGRSRHPPPPRLFEEVVVVFVGLEAEERELKAVLTPARLGMAGPHVAAGLGEDRHDVGGKAYGPIGGNDRGSLGRWDQGEKGRCDQRGKTLSSPAGAGRRAWGKPSTADRFNVSRVPSLRCHDRVPWREPGLQGRAKIPLVSIFPEKILPFSGPRVHLGCFPPFSSALSTRIVEFEVRRIRWGLQEAFVKDLRRGPLIPQALTLTDTQPQTRQSDRKDAPRT